MEDETLILNSSRSPSCRLILMSDFVLSYWVESILSVNAWAMVISCLRSRSLVLI